MKKHEKQSILKHRCACFFDALSITAACDHGLNENETVYEHLREADSGNLKEPEHQFAKSAFCTEKHIKQVGIELK